VGGTNLKIVLSTAESGHFARAKAAASSSDQVLCQALRLQQRMQSQTAGSAVGRIAVLWRSEPMHCLVREPFDGVLRFQPGRTRDLSQVGNCDFLEMVPFHCHKQRLDMTKTELQVALAAATETNKSTAGVFLETLGALAYKIGAVARMPRAC